MRKCTYLIGFHAGSPLCTCLCVHACVLECVHVSSSMLGVLCTTLRCDFFFLGSPTVAGSAQPRHARSGHHIFMYIHLEKRREMPPAESWCAGAQFNDSGAGAPADFRAIVSHCVGSRIHEMILNRTPASCLRIRATNNCACASHGERAYRDLSIAGRIFLGIAVRQCASDFTAAAEVKHIGTRTHPSKRYLCFLCLLNCGRLYYSRLFVGTFADFVNCLALHAEKLRAVAAHNDILTEVLI